MSEPMLIIAWGCWILQTYLMYDQNDELIGGGTDISLDMRVVTRHQCLFSYSSFWTRENVNESSPTRATIKPLDG